MRVALLWFARLREVAGSERSLVDLPACTSTADILTTAANMLPAGAGLISRSRVAVDCAFVEGPVNLAADCDIAIIPPVSGG